MQRQRYTIIGTKNGFNVRDFIMAYSETEAKLIYRRSRPDVEVTECYITKANDWHNKAQKELEQGYNSLKDKIDDGCIRAYEVRCTDIIDNKPVLEIHSQMLRRKVNLNFEVDKREQDRIEFSNGSSIEFTKESDIPIKYRGSAIHITDGDEDDSDVSK